MPTRSPLATIYCYVIAGLFAAIGIITILSGVIGAGTAPSSGLSREFAELLGTSFVYIGFSQLLVAGGFVAAGLVVHDIRRIAENTSAIASNQGNAGLSPPSYSRGTPNVEAVFFYFEKSVGGVRQSFEMSDLEP